jgi:4-hydroxymandelate oxidase
MLVDVSEINLTTKVLGTSLQLVRVIAPMAFQCLAHPEGEIATASAAASAGVGMVLSTLSTSSLEEVATVSNSLQLVSALHPQR